MKTKVANLPDQFLTDLKTSGLTYEEMMEKYGLTRWGARKIGNHDSIEQEKAGNHEKIFALNKETNSFKSFEVPLQEEEVNHEEQTRSTQKAKQTFTKKAGTYLKELEKEVKNVETPELAYEEPEFEDTGCTAIIHETDSHFSAKVKNRKGETVYGTETAKQATNKAFEWYITSMSMYHRDIDNIVLLLGGDLMEGEDIYPSQAHKIDETLDGQITAARNCYFENIKFLKNVVNVPIKIVCVSGNHGNTGTSSNLNADDIVYSMLEDMIGISDLKDIKFVRSDRSDYTTFTFRNWNGYLTHGENRREHIGTSSPQSDWLAIKDKFGFDLAFRGHYHNQKQENVNGAPVVMTNSRKPGDDYTDKIATFGVTGNAIYFATDDEPLKDTKVQTNVLSDLQ